MREAEMLRRNRFGEDSADPVVLCSLLEESGVREPFGVRAGDEEDDEPAPSVLSWRIRREAPLALAVDAGGGRPSPSAEGLDGGLGEASPGGPGPSGGGPVEEATAMSGPRSARLKARLQSPPPAADRPCAWYRRLTLGVGGTRMRGGCGLVNSCRGVCPNSLICTSSARRSIGSLTASRSTAPSYVSGWKTLFASTASRPRCL
mmetsp:Transcript_24340/g.58022  ORF Transcript_24340/g.58022 Transcript_24340/m.58022 type:complete len:204 (+) Transcript_24340:420-1031(+)